MLALPCTHNKVFLCECVRVCVKAVKDFEEWDPVAVESPNSITPKPVNMELAKRHKCEFMQCFVCVYAVFCVFLCVWLFKGLFDIQYEMFICNAVYVLESL